MDKKYKKKILFITALCLTLVAYTNKKVYHPNYEILNEEDGPFASYSEGLVYIGDQEYLQGLHNITSNDILIRDERESDDPNMEIISSSNIRNKETRNEILEILCYYEQLYPSYWDRSIESMRLEWFCHNICYYFNYKTDHSEEVDLNNSDEKKYDHEAIRRILRL